MENHNSLFSIPFMGYHLEFSLSILIQWIIIAILAIVSVTLTRNLKSIPDKRQSVAEILVETVSNLVKEIMGEKYLNFVPYVGTLAIFLLTMNLTGLVGFKPPTQDYSVALGLGLVTFLVVQGYAIKKTGLLHYFIAYGKPFAFLAPINILERVMLPVSLSLRLFGNMMAATVIMDLIYEGLHKFSWFAMLGIPIPLHGYFDIFDGAIQMAVFTMLTMINIKIISEH